AQIAFPLAERGQSRGPDDLSFFHTDWEKTRDPHLSTNSLRFGGAASRRPWCVGRALPWHNRACAASRLGSSGNRQVELVRNLDIHFERRHRVAAIHPDLNLVRFKGNM